MTTGLVPEFVWQGEPMDGCALVLEPAPPGGLLDRVIARVGSAAPEAMRVAVPFGRLLERAGLAPSTWWSKSATGGLCAPLGPAGARKVQYLELGVGTAIHALVVGRVGSGKSNLLHIIIMTLCLAYSPEELELYLIDFKEGVEFKPYARERLPHARVVAIQTDREFGLSVLQGLDAELKRRGELFRSVGEENLAGYRGASGKLLPRILMLVDEFQEFFSEDDALGREAKLLLDRVARQGRAFGIHMVLSSQTLTSSRMPASSTLEQIGVRIALQCSERDSRLVFADDNPDARLLSRPGEAIYNASNGFVEGNNLFQVALLGDEDRIESLSHLRSMLSPDREPPRPIVFEGGEPAQLAECVPLCYIAARKPSEEMQRAPRAWLGEPVAMRPPTAVRFDRQSARSLITVTRDESEGLEVMAAVVLSMLAQARPEGLQCFVADYGSPESVWAKQLRSLSERFPERLRLISRRGLPETLQALGSELDRRMESDLMREPCCILVCQGLHRARDLRKDASDDLLSPATSAADLLARILREGPEYGVHVAAWCDTVANIDRAVEFGLREFGLRVAGAMDNDESHRIIDSAAASRLERGHYMVFADDERPGVVEKFRPYALPGEDWLKWFCGTLASR